MNKRVVLRTAALEDNELDLETAVQDMPGNDDADFDDMQSLEENLEALAEAQRVAIASESMCAKLSSQKSITKGGANALSLAVEELCNLVGYRNADNTYPKISHEDFAQSVESFKKVIVAIYDRIIALCKHVIEMARNLAKNVMSSTIVVKAQALKVSEKLKNYHPFRDSALAVAINRKIDNDNSQLGVFASEVVVEEVANLDEKLTSGLNHADKVTPHGIISTKMAQWMVAPDGKPIRVNAVVHAVDETQLLANTVSDVMRRYIDDAGQHFSRYDESKPIDGVLGTFGFYAKHNLIPKLNSVEGGKMVADLKIVKSESTVTDTDDISSMEMTIKLPMAEYLQLEYHESTGALLVSARHYTPELKEDTFVRLCPQDQMGDILAKITSGSDEVINEAKVFDTKAEGLIKKLTALMEKAKAKASTQTEEQLEDLSQVHTDQTHQFQHCIRILSGLQLFFSRVVSYYNKLNVILLEWVDRSLTEYTRVEKALETA